MSIGIYDGDQSTYLLVPFNLTAMKLSSYYKSKRDIVLLMQQFVTNRSSKIFFVKDWDDGNYPNGLFEKNVTYYGHAFSGPQYVSLDEEIECQPPDTSIYSIMEGKILEDATQYKKRIWTDMMEGEHCRFSLDGKTIWRELDSQFNNLNKTKSILIHDYDLGKIDGAWEALQDILSECRQGRLAPNIGMKFPTTVYSGKELIKWSSIKVHSIFYSLRYNGVIEEKDFIDWCANGYQRAAYAMLEYYVTDGAKDEEDFVLNRLPKIFRQVIISRSYRLKITLKYKDEFFIHKEWCQLLELFNYYQHSMFAIADAGFIQKVQNDTLFDFAKKSLMTYGKYPKMMTRDEMRNLFLFVQENNNEVFKMFYEMNYLSLKEEKIFYD